RPGGPGWNRVSREAGDTEGESLAPNFLNWLLGCVCIYSCLFGIGAVVLGEMIKGIAFIIAGLIAGAVIFWNLERIGWKSYADDRTQLTEAVDSKAAIRS